MTSIRRRRKRVVVFCKAPPATLQRRTSIELSARKIHGGCVFQLYSRKDHYFAELADIKLSEAGIKLWARPGATALAATGVPSQEM